MEKIIISVIGCPRSGTTLTQAQLVRNFNLTPIAETHFINLFKRYQFLWSNCKSEKARIELLTSLQEFTKLRWGIVSGYTLDQIRKMGILPTIEHKERLSESSSNYTSLINEIFRRHAVLSESSGIVEKFSYYHPVKIQELSEILHSSKFIHVVRDGRDVILSWRKTWFGPKTVSEAARLWQSHVNSYTEWGRLNPNRYMEIDFTDMLTNEKETLDSISKFIGVKRQNSDQCRNKIFDLLAERKHYSKSSSNLDPQNHSKWPHLMPKEDALLFWQIAGETAKTKGHMEPNDITTAISRIKIFDEFISQVIENLFGKVIWKRRLLTIMPLIIKLCQICNISIYNSLKRLGK